MIKAVIKYTSFKKISKKGENKYKMQISLEIKKQTKLTMLYGLKKLR